MAVVRDSELVKSLRSGKYDSVYYFYGKDIMTIELYTKRIIQKLLGSGDNTYNFHRFEGRSLDLSELAECTEALPFLSGYVCAVINDLDAENLSASDLKFLIELLENLTESTVVIFYNTSVDITDGRKFPTAKNKKLIDCCSKAGSVCEFGYKKPSELVKPVMEAVLAAGSSISPKNAEYLASLCLSDMLMVSNEIQKLASYAAGNEITSEIIDMLVSKQLDSNAFALAKAVTAFRTSEALRILDELFAQRAEPVAVLSAVSMSFMDIYRAKAAINANKSISDVTEDFGYKSNRSFAAVNAFRDAGKISDLQLRNCIKILADTDIDLKSGRTDGRLLLEKAITEMAVLR